MTATLAESLAPIPLHHSTPAPAYSPGPYHPTPSPYHAPTPYPPAYSPSPAPYHPASPAPYHHPKGYCDPKLPPYCANATGLHYCLEDPHYPEYEIKSAISADYLFEKKYSDVADQSANDLVQHLDQYTEAAFDYKYYTGASKGPSPYDVSHWIGPEGYLCPSEVLYAMPKRARNVNGDWRVIVNAHYYTQTTRLETCLTPDSACRLLAPCYQVPFMRLGSNIKTHSFSNFRANVLKSTFMSVCWLMILVMLTKACSLTCSNSPRPVRAIFPNPTIK